MSSAIARVIRCFGLSGLMLAAAGPAPAAADGAPDVVVFCEPTLQHALADAAALWRQQTGVPVHVILSPTKLLLEQISHNIRSDLIIGEGEAAAAAATERKLIKPETRVDLWRNRLVVVELGAGQQHPSLPLTAAALTAAGPVAIVDRAVASAGADTRTALEAAGLWDLVQSRSIGAVSTGDASFLLAAGPARSAVLYATDLAANPDFVAVGVLADDTYPPIRYWIAQTSAQISPNAAGFEAFLGKPGARDSVRKDGLEVLP
jgi:molybdate transport system substrate-binding protein